MTTIKKTTKIPRLRFPEFHGEWEEKKLGDLFSEVLEKVGNNKVETYSITAGVGFVSQVEKFGRDISGTQNDKYTLLSPGQFSYNKGNSKTFKFGCVYANKFNRKIAVPNVFISFKMKDGAEDVDFYAKLFEKHTLDKELRKIISSGARMDGLLNVSKQDFFKIPIVVSNSTHEQQKIATFLTSVDDWLENLRAQKVALEKYKRGMMQKIFSQEIRFRDDDGRDFPEWEEKRLGEVSSFFSGGTPSSTNLEYYSGNIPFIKSGEISNDITTQFITDNAIKNSSAKLVNRGDLLFALYGATSGSVALSKLNGAINQAVLCIRTSQNVKYLFYYLMHEKEKILTTFLQGGQGNLSADIVKKIKFPEAAIAEQQKIADFLTSIDELITSKDEQISKAEQWKKGLMQGMFV